MTIRFLKEKWVVRSCTIFAFGLAMEIFAPQALARPEFAARIGNNRCTNCHYSATGGGPRNLNGKEYGAAGFKLSPFSNQPYAGADVKFLYFAPDKHSQARGGLANMSTNLQAAIPIYDAETRVTRLVGEYNLGGFSASGARLMFLQSSVKDENATSWLPQHIQFGRFIPPFGLLTDEHRTYVRLQTASAWHQGIRMGALLSSNPFEAFHYDLAVFNGQENVGQTLSDSQSSQWGGVVNLRFMISQLGLMFGASSSYYDASSSDAATAAESEPRRANTVYSVLSLHRLTGDLIPVSVLLEYAEAKNWNVSSFTGVFIADSAYQTSIEQTESRGALVQVNWELTPLVTLTYKYDYLVLDRDYPADAFQRHGFGFKHYFGPNLWLQMRYENAIAGREAEKNGNKTGGLDAFWAVVSAGI